MQQSDRGILPVASTLQCGKGYIAYTAVHTVSKKSWGVVFCVFLCVLSCVCEAQKCTLGGILCSACNMPHCYGGCFLCVFLFQVGKIVV